MDIDMKELEAFVAVVDQGSFSRAAKTLYLTQPTVSTHIATLERKLGIKLLVRTTKEIYPSDAGTCSTATPRRYYGCARGRYRPSTPFPTRCREPLP